MIHAIITITVWVLLGLGAVAIVTITGVMLLLGRDNRRVRRQHLERHRPLTEREEAALAALDPDGNP